MTTCTCPVLPVPSEAHVFSMHKATFTRLLELVQKDHSADESEEIISLVQKIPAVRSATFLYECAFVLLSKQRFDHEIVHAILRACPEVASRSDHLLMLPLHLLLARREEVDVNLVERLIELNPAGLCARNSNGDTPLHVYLRLHRQHLPDAAVVKCALRSCPKSARVANGSGQLPLHLAVHLAVRSHVDHEYALPSIKLILEAMPEAACVEVTERVRVHCFASSAWLDKVSTWTPLQRVIDSKMPHAEAVFDRVLNRRGIECIKARRHR